MDLIEYWEKRCELAEKYIDNCPCDPDVSTAHLEAYNEWCAFKKLNLPDVMRRRELLGKFYIHLSEQAVINEEYRNDEEMAFLIMIFGTINNFNK